MRTKVLYDCSELTIVVNEIINIGITISFQLINMKLICKHT